MVHVEICTIGIEFLYSFYVLLDMYYWFLIDFFMRLMRFVFGFWLGSDVYMYWFLMDILMRFFMFFFDGFWLGSDGFVTQQKHRWLYQYKNGDKPWYMFFFLG